jgi:hypothetical protein
MAFPKLQCSEDGDEHVIRKAVQLVWNAASHKLCSAEEPDSVTDGISRPSALGMPAAASYIARHPLLLQREKMTSIIRGTYLAFTYLNLLPSTPIFCFPSLSHITINTFIANWCRKLRTIGPVVPLYRTNSWNCCAGFWEEMVEPCILFMEQMGPSVLLTRYHNQALLEARNVNNFWK